MRTIIVLLLVCDIAALLFPDTALFAAEYNPRRIARELGIPLREFNSLQAQWGIGFNLIMFAGILFSFIGMSK